MAILIIAMLVACLTSLSSQASTDLLDRVITATTPYEIIGTTDPTMEQRRVIWDMPYVLADHIIENESNSRAWEAFHHFRTLTDAGLSLFFEEACFYAVTKRRTIFFDRYLLGDDRALDRMVDAVRANLVGDSESIARSNAEARRIFRDLIEQIESEHTLMDSKTKFIKVLRNEWDERQKFIQSEWTGASLPAI